MLTFCVGYDIRNLISFMIPKLNKEAMWLYAELFLGIWNVQKCQNVQILKLLGVLCRNK